MSSAPSNTSLSANAGREKSVIWLGTWYFDLKPHNIASMNQNIIWKSDLIKPGYVYIALEFQFVRVSELQFNVTCLRYHGTPDGVQTPSGYTLQFHCSINMFSEGEPRFFEMQSHEFIVIEQFELEPSYLQSLSPADLFKPFEIKVLAKMIEFDCAGNDISVQQNEHLRMLQLQSFNYITVLRDLCYILHIPRFENIFTGRQNTVFSKVKSLCIQYASRYSKDIAEYLRAKESCVAVPVTDLGLILNFIFYGVKEPITDDNLFQGYLAGHLMGLDFLVELCRDCILGRLPKNAQTRLIDALSVSDEVNDGILFEKAAEKFQEWERELQNPEVLFNPLRSRGVKGHFVIQSLTRRTRRIEAGRRAAEVGESSQSSALGSAYISL